MGVLNGLSSSYLASLSAAVWANAVDGDIKLKCELSWTPRQSYGSRTQPADDKWKPPANQSVLGMAGNRIPDQPSWITHCFRRSCFVAPRSEELGIATQ